MIKNVTDQCDRAANRISDFFESNTSAKKAQRLILGFGILTAWIPKAVAQNYYPNIGNALPVLGGLLIVALSILGIRSIRDYENVAEGASMREEALPLNIAQLMKSHGSVKTILDAGILTAEELTDKVRVYLQADNTAIKKHNQSVGKNILEKKILVSVIRDSAKQMKGSLDRIEQAVKWLNEIEEWEVAPKL